MDPSPGPDAPSENEDDGRLLLPAPTGPSVTASTLSGEITELLIIEDEEEDTTVEANDAAMRALATPPVSLSTPLPGDKIVPARPPQNARASARPRRALSWPITIAAALIGFVLGGFFFGGGGPATPPTVSSSSPTTTSAPAPVQAVAAPPPSAPVVEAIQPSPPPAPPPPHHPKKVVKLDEVVLTTPDTPAR